MRKICTSRSKNQRAKCHEPRAPAWPRPKSLAPRTHASDAFHAEDFIPTKPLTHHVRRRLTRKNCGGRDTSMQTHRTNSWRAILIQPSARLRPMSLALHTKASYASRAEAVTPVRRRTARTAGGQSSHSHPPGRDRSRSRPAPMPLTHFMRRTLFPSLPSSIPIPGWPPFPRDVASTLLFRRSV